MCPPQRLPKDWFRTTCSFQVEITSGEKKVAREVYLLRERTWSGGKRRQAALYFERACV